MSSQDIHIQESPADNNARVKTPPNTGKIPVPFFYAPSDDGTDENLLILLHGLGDTHTPFSKLGRQLKLPQTAVLALRAPDQVPFLYEESYAWFPSFDDLGELLENPNPTSALDLMERVLRHLVADCAWPAHRIHLFGFAQGGSVAAECALRWWKAEPQAPLGSVVSISGPLLSYPTAGASLAPTPLLAAHRPGDPAGALPAFRKGFRRVVENKMGAGAGMPAAKAEWEPIMRFWSENLGRRRVEGVYEVMSGMSS
ncbi:Alpha/Beta hydrolase protein [Mycena rebaudengoi]|nr:Alpha/Beta hydrolase protein [Mycena rebaudengoi]